MESPINTTTAPTSTIETVDAATATAWLGANTNNRNVRKKVVATYARDMTEGRWQFTGESVKFAHDGTLLDGQHRLMAIVEANSVVPMLVVRGLPRDTQDVMDTGSKRTASDALSLHGEKNSALLASTAAMILTEGDRFRRTCSTAELMAVIDRETTLRTITSEIVPSLRITTSTPTVIAYTYWRLDKVDASDAAKFFDSLSTLVDLPAGSPILALHRRLAGHSRKSSSQQYRQEALAYFFMAWNAWRKNESRSIIKLAYSNGRVSVPEPI